MATFILTLDITPNSYKKNSDNRVQYFIGKVIYENHEIACKKVEDKIKKDGIGSLIDYLSYDKFHGYTLSTIDEIVEVEL